MKMIRKLLVLWLVLAGFLGQATPSALAAVDVLLQPVPAGQQLPGGCWDFAGSTNGGFWAKTDSTGEPDLGTKEFACLMIFRYGAASTQMYLWSVRVDAQNWIAVRRQSANTLSFVWFTGNTVRAECITPTLGEYSSHNVALLTRTGNNFNLYVYQGAGTSTLDIADSNTATISAGDTYTTTLSNAAGCAMRIGHLDGTTNSQKWNGAIGLIMFAICPTSDTLAAHGLNTDTARKLVMLDPQRILKVHNFATSDIVAYGNWADSSGVAKTALTRTQFAANDRCVCPFSGKYLTLAAGSAQATELACPPYTMPATADPIVAWRGSTNWFDCPYALENPGGGWILTRNQVDAQNNPTFYLDFLGTDGLINRWPYPIPYRYDVDGTARWNQLTGTTHIGDSHSACPLIYAKETDGRLKSIVCQPYLHSNTLADVPSAGLTTRTLEQYVILSDDAVPQTVSPAGADVRTYALSERRGQHVITCSRVGSATGARILFSTLADSDYATTRQVCFDLDGGGVLRNYPGHIINMHDGRSIVLGLGVANDNGVLTHVAIIAPPQADLATSSAWFSPTGHNCSGSDGVTLLGGADPLNDFNDFAIVRDNESFFDSLPLPAGGAGMDHLLMENPVRIQGDIEGFAAIVRTSTGNGDLSNTVALSSGGSSVPMDKSELRRWTYTGGATPTLAQTGNFDITSIIATLNPGTWPQAPAETTAECQWLWCWRIGVNKMLMIVVDPENVAIGTNKSYWANRCGFTYRGVIFHDLTAADPRDFIEFVDVVDAIATDNSQGFGMVPYFVGTGNDGSRSLISVRAGGDWTSLGWGNRLVKGIDLRASLRTNYELNSLYQRRVAGYQGAIAP